HRKQNGTKHILFDIKKYMLGSILLAVPIFLLLNLFFTIKPATLLGVCWVLILAAMLLYATQLHAIYKKETNASDKALQKHEKKKQNGVYEEVKKKKSGFLAGTAAAILALLIIFFKPVSDIYYYTGALLAGAAILYLLMGVMRDYNRLAMRKLPQFEKRGGDEHADM
ncbi:MAG TPA: hypothetical protein PLU43_07820, partial [Lachnospiraceae bacterium]|nr:hypothetical protein [Lachnospiraceae bacterium]